MLSLKKCYCVVWKQCASTFAWGVFFFQTLSLTLSRRLDTLDAPDSNKRLIFILEHGSLKHIEFSSASTSTLKIHMTSSQINDTFLFQRVLKILTACRILQISIARCQKEGVRSREFMHTHMCTVKHFLYCMVNTESVSKHRTVQYFKFNSFLMIIIKNNIINIIVMVCRNNKEAYPEPCREFTLKESFWFALTSFTPQVIMANIWRFWSWWGHQGMIIHGWCIMN